MGACRRDLRATHRWSVWAGDEFKKRANGKYEIQVFPASSPGKESDINQGVQLDTLDVILTGASFATNSYPRLAVSYYPFTFCDADHVTARPAGIDRICRGRHVLPFARSCRAFA